MTGPALYLHRFGMGGYFCKYDRSSLKFIYYWNGFLCIYIYKYDKPCFIFASFWNEFICVNNSGAT